MKSKNERELAFECEPEPSQATVSTTSTTFQIPFDKRRFSDAEELSKEESFKIMNETKVGFRLNVLIA